MDRLSTEMALREWRNGQTYAERLCAQLLHLEAFESVDPQHPLGGPDGRKDLLCRKNGKLWVAASYFPPTPPTFNEIKKKFSEDFGGVEQNGAAGFLFFVNHPLTIIERKNLLTVSSPVETEIYHLERIRALLDSPKGTGIRLEYLRIPMTGEEQWAFASQRDDDVAQQIRTWSEKFDNLSNQLSALHTLLTHPFSNPKKAENIVINGQKEKSQPDEPSPHSLLRIETDNVFLSLNDQEFFVEFIANYFADAPRMLFLEAFTTISAERIRNAFHLYRRNISNYQQINQPDHYRCAGALLHALNQKSIVAEFHVIPEMIEKLSVATKDPGSAKELLSFYSRYCNQLLAFDVAYRCCACYEKTPRLVHFDYLTDICAFLDNHSDVNASSCSMIFRSLML